jgi:glycosyltransferase involved in cell wall biosynthesis
VLRAISKSDALPTNGRPISVCLLVSSLEFGGAERQVIEMYRSFDPQRIKPLICSLSREMPQARHLPKGGKEVRLVEKRARFDLTVVFRLARVLRQEEIAVVHAFLLDAEIASRLAAPIARVPVVVASERNTDYVRPLSHWIALKLTQPLFDVMVANSHAGKRFNMRTLGLPQSRIEVVHNGVDTQRFHPDREAGLAFRKQFDLPAEHPVIGMVASFKRQKGHDLFLRMAAQVRNAFPKATFLMVGGAMRENSGESSRCETEIKELTATLNLTDCCRFIPNQTDMRVVYNACDMTVLLSRREGTPNVLLESMACGVPVVATNVADNALLIEEGVTGYTVPPEDSDGAARRVEGLLSNPALRAQMGEAARTRACGKFSLRRAASELEDIYARCLAAKSRAAGTHSPQRADGRGEG